MKRAAKSSRKAIQRRPTRQRAANSHRPPRHATRPAQSQAIALRVPASPHAEWLLNDEQVTLIKNTVAKGATDQELQLFLTTAKRHRLDPFTHQIWFVRRWDKNADSGKRTADGQAVLGSYVGITQVGIDGLLHVAARDHKDFGSVSRIEYGPMVSVGKIKAPEFAVVKLFKKGVAEPTYGEAFWEEYAPSDLEKAPFWRKMPRRMLGKCAVALALRQAYPDLSGVYIPEETQRIAEEYTESGRKVTPIEPAAPAMNPHEAKYLEREKRDIDKLTPDQRDIVKAKIEAAKNPPLVSAKPTPALFYYLTESGTYAITGDVALKTANKDLLLPLWNDGVKSIVADPKQLGHLIRQFEIRKVPFRDLSADREPGAE